MQALPGGPVVKNPPCNAREAGSVPGQGRSHMPRVMARNVFFKKKDHLKTQVRVIHVVNNTHQEWFGKKSRLTQ